MLSVAMLLAAQGGDVGLTGRWHQQSASGCGTNPRPVAELVFGAGTYTYTFPEQMFETMTSGGGDYRWDAATGALKLDVRDGKATLDGGTLILEGLPFDWVRPEVVGVDPRTQAPIMAPDRVCRIVFARSGPRR